MHTSRKVPETINIIFSFSFVAGDKWMSDAPSAQIYYVPPQNNDKKKNYTSDKIRLNYYHENFELKQKSL